MDRLTLPLLCNSCALELGEDVRELDLELLLVTFCVVGVFVVSEDILDDVGVLL